MNTHDFWFLTTVLYGSKGWAGNHLEIKKILLKCNQISKEKISILKSVEKASDR